MKSRILTVLVAVGVLFWGVYASAGVHYTNPTMQVEVTGFDGSIPVAVTVSGGSSTVGATTADGGSVSVRADDNGALQVNPAAQTSCQSSVVVCGVADAGGSVALPSSALSGRRYLEAQNQGTESVYIDEGADAGYGRRLFAGEEKRWDCAPSACALRCFGYATNVYVRECQ
jgi:hypothetical protein